MAAFRSLRPPLALLLLATLSLIGASACTGIASPEGWASPFLVRDASGSEVLLAAHRDRLLALEAETLEARWRFPVEDGDDGDIDAIALYGTPAALGDDLILIPGYDSTLYAVASDTGELRWEFDTGDSLIGGVTASDTVAYFGSTDARIYAVDTRGTLVWSRPFKTGEPVWSTPTLAGDTLFVTSLDHRLYALDAESGEERWSFSTAAGVASTPVVDQQAGLVYVGGFDSRLRAIDTESGEERWAISANNWFWATPLLDQGTLYAGSLDGKMYAVDALTGRSRWEKAFETEAPIRSAPVLAGGALMVVDRDGAVYRVDPDDGSEMEGSPLALGDDVLADPLLLASAADGPAVAIVTTKGELVLFDAERMQVLDRIDLGGD